MAAALGSGTISFSSSALISGWPAGSSKLAVTNMIKISLDVLVGRRSKEPAGKRDVPQDRNLVLGLLNVLPHQAPDHDGLAVVNRDFSSDFASRKDRLVDHVLA